MAIENINDNITRMQDMLYDPTLVQDELLTLLDNASDGVVNIPDPNNPWTYLMETNIIPISAAFAEITQIMRNIHPILANTNEELYPHLVDSDLSDTYATPSKAMFTFYINKKQIVDNGYVNTNSKEIVIPKKSMVSINDIDFTILNDINIALFDNNNVFVKIIGNNDVMAINENILIPAGIVTDENHIEWVIFEIELPQLKLITIKDSILQSVKYSKDVIITKQFSHIEINTVLNDTDNKLDISYSNFVYNKDIPTAYVKKLDGKINIEIPYFYTLNGLLGSEVSINVFTTEGDIIEPVSNYNPDDVTIKFNIGLNQDPRVISINNLSIFAKANTFTYGGRDEIDFITLKNKIINNTTGENIIPITEYDVKEELSKEGFILRNSTDSVFNREYIVHKYINTSNKDIVTQMDILMDTVTIDSTDIDDYYVINNNNYIIVNPFTTFSYENNKINILSKTIIDNIYTLTKENLNAYINSKRLFYTIYKYILDYKDTLNCRVYDINTPKLTNVKNNISNTNLGINLTVVDRNITRVEDTFVITYTMVGDSVFTNMDTSKIRGQLSLRHNDTNTFVYIDSPIIENNGAYTCTLTIDTTGYIDKDNNVYLQNYNGDVNLANMNLAVTSDFILYSTDVTLTNDKTSKAIEVYNTDVICDIYVETLDITIGKQIVHLYNKYTIDYTSRKYLKYDSTIYLTYTETIYQYDANGIVVDYIDTTGDSVPDTAVPVVLHNIGDNVLDENDNDIILHNVGDVILDINGNPTIDPTYGILHNIDILLLEYETKLANNSVYSQYVIDTYNNITNICTTYLSDINNKLLDNTNIKYKPLTILENVNLIVNNIVYNNPNFITPTITVYVKDIINDKNIIKSLKDVLSLTLQNGLREESLMSDIITEMLTYKDIEILSINITDIDIIKDTNIKKYADNSSQFIIDKQLVSDSEGNLTVELNTSLVILTI